MIALAIRPIVGLGRTRHGYVDAGPSTTVCHVPIEDGALVVTPEWIRICFMPAYAQARTTWGGNAASITTEILSDLAPGMRVRRPKTGAERELRRRVELAVAVLLNAAGVPTRYPADPITPRPRVMPAGPAWYRALMTGWSR
ncbi:MAG: hypothetical protein K0U16_07245 [Gammaproteobacteria bacterium]|nr:hypothetical protein [Gammaproteobacteria bacterium]